jgi:hypothetical protein
MNNIIIFCFLTLTFFYSGNEVKDLYQSLPKECNGWKVTDKDETFDRETLYNYVDGGAELYLTYGYKQLFVRKYSKPDNPDVMLEIFDMGSSQEAFGIFSSERQDDDINIGSASEYGGGLLRFWKGRYFITMMTMGDDKDSKPTVLEIGKTVAGLIDEEGKEPDIISILPKEGLLKNRIRYFHNFEILNRQYFISNENILGLDKNTNCVFAKYKKDTNTCNLLIIHYEGDAKAINAYNNFLKIYLPEGKALKLENNKWTIIDRIKNYITIVFDSPKKDFADNLLSKINIK